MRESWERRIQRAEQLAAKDESTASLLAFYVRVLRSQKSVGDWLRTRRAWMPSGSLERDLPAIRPEIVALVRAIADHAPQTLAAEAGHLLAGSDSTIDNALLAWWHAPSDRQFFPKAALQPYAQWLAETGVTPTDRELTRASNRCRFCGGAPQLSILERGSDADGGGRLLLCANCLTSWPFRRVVCAWCGEEDERKLGYFHSPAFDHLRVDACDTCRRYLKAVDLTRLGLAVPIVDEAAGAPLDLWAREHGYEKIELNLLGL